MNQSNSQVEADVEDVVESPFLFDYALFVDAMWQGSNPDIAMSKERMVNILRACLGLQEEAGELAGKLKKYFRGDFGRDLPKEDIIKEMGDTLFYMFALMNLLEIDPYEVFHVNVEKLTDRKKRGVLKGSGDNR